MQPKRKESDQTKRRDVKSIHGGAYLKLLLLCGELLQSGNRLQL